MRLDIPIFDVAKGPVLGLDVALAHDNAQQFLLRLVETSHSAETLKMLFEFYHPINGKVSLKVIQHIICLFSKFFFLKSFGPSRSSEFCLNQILTLLTQVNTRSS